MATIQSKIEGNDYSEIELIVNSLDLFNLDDKVSQYKIKLIRLFIKKLLSNLKERNSYLVPIINGLHETTDDYTFVTCVYTLRKGLWN